jgi:hypothetical protein
VDENEFRIEQAKLLSNESVASAQIHTPAIMGFAMSAMRGAFLLNGSAAITILAKDDFIRACPSVIFLFAIGAAFAVLSAGASYFAQGKYAAYARETHMAAVNQFATGQPQDMAMAGKILAHGKKWTYSGVTFCILSLVVYFIALSLAYKFFK